MTAMMPIMTSHGDARPVVRVLVVDDSVVVRTVIERILNQPLTVVALGPIDASALPTR